MGVTGSLVDEWEPTILNWLAQGEYEKVLSQLEAWDIEGIGWWTRYGKHLDQIPTSLIRKHPRIVLRTVIPLVWAGKEVEAYAVQQAIEDQLNKQGDSGLVIEAQINRAGLYLVTHKWQKAMEAFERISKDELTVIQKLYVLNALGLLEATKTFELSAARDRFLACEEIALDAGNTISLIVALTNRAWHVELLHGKFHEAILIADKMVSIRQVSGEYRFPRACAQLIRGAAEFELGREQAIATLEEAYRLSIELEYRDNAFAAAEMLACRYAERRMRDLTAKWIDACRSIHGVDTMKTPAIHWAEARDSANRGDVSRCLRHLDAASKASEGLDLQVGSHIEKARCLYELSRCEEAATEAEKAVEMADRFGFQYQAARARLILCACEVRGVRTELQKLLQSAARENYDELFSQRDPVLASRIVNQAITLEVELDYARSLAAKMGEGLVRVRMFGGLQVGIGDDVLSEEAWQRPRARALFTYLCLHHRQPVPVDELVEAFWPDSDFDSARNSLRVSMTHIRKALASVAGCDLRLDNEWVRLDLGAGSWFDFQSFERLASKCLDASKPADEIEHALLLGKLPFLPEYSSTDWVLDRKLAIDGIKRELSLLLVRRLAVEAIKAKAVVLCEELLASDPTDETALEELVRILLDLNRKRDAKRVLKQFCAVWQREYGMPVSSSINALHSMLEIDTVC